MSFRQDFNLPNDVTESLAPQELSDAILLPYVNEIGKLRRGVELGLIGAILADHRRMLHVAARAGLRGHHFTDDDLRLIYTCIHHARKREVADILDFAAKALDRADSWNLRKIPPRFGALHWTAKSLQQLANMHPATEAEVLRLAKKLANMHQRQQRIDATADDLGEQIDSFCSIKPEITHHHPVPVDNTTVCDGKNPRLSTAHLSTENVRRAA